MREHPKILRLMHGIFPVRDYQPQPGCTPPARSAGILARLPPFPRSASFQTGLHLSSSRELPTGDRRFATGHLPFTIGLPMNLQNSTFVTPCTKACCEEWLFLTTWLGSGAQSASKCRGIPNNAFAPHLGTQPDGARSAATAVSRVFGSGDVPPGHIQYSLVICLFHMHIE